MKGFDNFDKSLQFRNEISWDQAEQRFCRCLLITFRHACRTPCEREVIHPHNRYGDACGGLQITAWRSGADFVKVFPCAQVGGDAYIRALSRSLPHLPIVAAGGVNQQNAEAFMIAGAIAIGVGSQLIPVEAIERKQAKRIQELALRFSKFVREARLRVPPKPPETIEAAHISARHCDT